MWGTAVLIETDNAGGAYSPQVAVDANGNATAVWYQDDGAADSIWSNRYDATSGMWGTAVLIETDNTGGAYQPQVAVDAHANVTAIWYQNDGTSDKMWSNRYDATLGMWGTAVRIQTDTTEYASGPQLAVDANGNATAVWYQYGGALNDIWSTRFD